MRRGAREPLDRPINANLRRVVNLAGEFLGQGLGYLDLIAEGTLGLISAIRQFDERGRRHFTRCADDRIRRQIRQALGETALQPQAGRSAGQGRRADGRVRVVTPRAARPRA